MEVAKGLEGIYAVESAIATIDGLKGILHYRGYNIHDLAEKSTFEETCYLLLYGELPTKEQLKEFEIKLKEQRELPKEIVKLIKILPAEKPMSTLRTVVSAIGLYDKDADALGREALIDKSINLIAKLPVIVASIGRVAKGEKILKPKKGLSTAANFLYMLHGKRPDKFHARVFDICLILHAEHELNASSFTARATASTLSDIYSATTSAIGALKGAWHGGANEQVIKMLREIGSAERVESYLREKIEKKERIIGFGHRVYKAKDPRATILERYSKELAEKAGDNGNNSLYQISKKIEDFMSSQQKLTEKGIFVNVDFYSASVYTYLDIPPSLFTPIFAASRMSGWAAQLLEQYADNRIFRPRAKYVGAEERNYVSINKR